MFEDNKELTPAIELFGVDILKAEFKKLYLNENYRGHSIDALYLYWKHETL